MSAVIKAQEARPVRDQVSAEEWQTRQELAACYRLAALWGWTDHIYTHFSARVPGRDEHFLINAFGLTFGEVTASNLVKVDLAGTVLLDATGRGHNQAGYVIHSAIHGARPDIKAVLHTHTTTGAAVSAQRDGLLMISQHAARYYQRVAYHDYEGFALNLDEQARLVRDLGDKRVLVLRNHGLLTAGRSVGEALQELYFLERACAIQVAALAGGVPLVVPAEAALVQAAQTYERASGGSYTTRNWEAFVRELDARDTSYRN
ncbi:class II aldolase/adducin family protein [Xanthobacter sp. V4C-4]|uniref:class II aldolase/adducin family protein n=1 Tax=Xanthobacter cornucopiae TaxID=3119924 RepID=UPI0037265FD8